MTPQRGQEITNCGHEYLSPVVAKESKISYECTHRDFELICIFKYNTPYELRYPEMVSSGTIISTTFLKSLLSSLKYL